MEALQMSSCPMCREATPSQDRKLYLRREYQDGRRYKNSAGSPLTVVPLDLDLPASASRKSRVAARDHARDNRPEPEPAAGHHITKHPPRARGIETTQCTLLRQCTPSCACSSGGSLDPPCEAS